MWYIYTMEYYSAIKKSEICNNMVGLGGYYAKWNKSDRKGQILYDPTYMWNLKKNPKLIETGNRLVAARGRG